MIKFFRKIRKNLIAESKLKNYLLYALGEIVLVVIGILIALQVNTWNQNRMNSKEEKQLFQAIHTKMEHNKFQVRIGSDRYEEVIHSSKQLIKRSTGEISSKALEDVNHLIHNLPKRFLVGNSNKTSIYDELVGSGKLNLLKSAKLRNELTSLKANMELLASYEEIQSSFVDNQVSPFLNKYTERLALTVNGFNTDTTFYDHFFAESYSNIHVLSNDSPNSALVQNREFINLMTELIYHTTALMPIYERIENNISTIQSLVSSQN